MLLAPNRSFQGRQNPPLPLQDKNPHPFAPNRSFWRRQSVLRETDMRTTPPSHSQSTALLLPPADHSGDDRTTPPKDRDPHPFAPDGSLRGRRSVLRKTYTRATYPSPEKVSQSIALPSPPTDHSGNDRAPPSKDRDLHGYPLPLTDPDIPTSPLFSLQIIPGAT